MTAPNTTPGPWVDFEDYEVSVDAESNVGNRIAGWFVVGNPDCANGEVAAIMHFHGTDEAQYIANGQLVIAAPCLYDALDRLLSLDSDGEAGCRVDPIEYGEALEQARTALSKARAQSPTSGQSVPGDGGGE